MTDTKNAGGNNTSEPLLLNPLQEAVAYNDAVTLINTYLEDDYSDVSIIDLKSYLRFKIKIMMNLLQCKLHNLEDFVRNMTPEEQKEALIAMKEESEEEDKNDERENKQESDTSEEVESIEELFPDE